MIQAFETPPTFFNNTEVSAIDLNVLRDNALALEGMTKRARNIHPIHYENDDFPKSDLAEGSLLFNGGFRYITGLTQAVLRLHSYGVTSNAKYKILFNNAIVASGAMTNNSEYDITIALPTLGYANNTLVYVEAYFYSSPSDYANKRPNNVSIVDAYVTPLASGMTHIWPGLPSVTSDTAISAADLNQISDAETWLAERVSLVPYTPFIAELYQHGTHKIQTLALYHMQVMRKNSNNTLYGTIYFVSRNKQTYIHISLEGGTYGTTVYGPYSYLQEVTIPVAINLATAGVPDGTRIEVTIAEVVTDGDPELPIIDSRATIRDFYISGASYVPGTAIAESGILESLTFTNLKARINNIITSLQASYDRIANNTDIFNKQSMSRSQMLLLNAHREKVGSLHLAGFIRRGDVLYVRGKGISIGYGGIATKRPDDSEDWTFEFNKSSTLIDGDANASKIFYLDQFEDLFPGEKYYIYGDELNYVAEYLA